MKRFLVLAAVLILLFVFGEAGLFLAGRLPQESILESIQESLPQMEVEFEKPYVLHDRSRNGIDNFTDSLILNLSYNMDTKSDPTAVLSNPLYWTDDLEPFQELKLVGDGQAANGNYTNYCMGFRIWMRPLLTVFNYMEIRNIFAFATWMLFGISLISVYRATGSKLFSALYALCIVSLNPIAISSSLTYMPSFLLAFSGMLIAPRIALHDDKNYIGMPLLFLSLGALTQFVDFYTYPLITFAFPMILLLFVKQRRAQIWSMRKSFGVMLRGLLAWAAAYVGMWLLKLAATAAFTNLDVTTTVANVLGSSVGVADESTGVLATLLACADNVLTPEIALSFGVAALIWLILFLKNPERKARLSEGWVYLLIAVLSILWIAFAKRTYLHRFFQYRILGVFLLGVFAFFAGTTLRNRSDEDSTNQNLAEESKEETIS